MQRCHQEEIFIQPSCCCEKIVTIAKQQGPDAVESPFHGIIAVKYVVSITIQHETPSTGVHQPGYIIHILSNERIHQSHCPFPKTVRVLSEKDDPDPGVQHGLYCSEVKLGPIPEYRVREVRLSVENQVHRLDIEAHPQRIPKAEAEGSCYRNAI